MNLLRRFEARWHSVRQNRWARWAIDSVIILLVLSTIASFQTRNHLPDDAPVPEFTLPTLAGGEVSSASLRGKPTMLVMWAPWCGVCKVESQNVSWVQKLVGDRANVLSIAASFEERSEVETYVRDQEVDYPVLLGDDAVLSTFRVSAFPTVYFLDAEGRVKGSAMGYTTTGGLLWRLLF